MKKEYKIKGMTCNGCKSHVEKAILDVAGVADISVDLVDAEAVIESQFEVPLENLREALKNSGGQYTIQPKGGVEENSN